MPAASPGGQEAGLAEAAAFPPIDRAFCEGAEKDWLQTELSCPTKPCPRTPCGERAVRVPPEVISLTRQDGSPDEASEDNIVFRLRPEGYWSALHTVIQEHACIARLCAPGRIIIESRSCFSRKPVSGPSVSIGGIYDAFCSPDRVPPGHYVATVDGLALEFDIQRRYAEGEWPQAMRDRVHPPFFGWPDAGSAEQPGTQLPAR